MESWSHGATSVTTFCTFANTMYLQLWDLLEGKNCSTRSIETALTNTMTKCISLT